MTVRIDVRRLPKVQLHCHLEGTVGPQTFRALAQRHRIDLGRRAALSDERLYDFADFQEFLLLFRDVSETLRTPEDFGRIAREYARDAATHCVRYAEMFISPSVWTWFVPDLDVCAAIAAIRAALEGERERGGPDVALICDLTRNFGPERASVTVQLAASLRHLGVIGVGLGGDEVHFPPELFGEAFDLARSLGLRRVVHAGEAAGAASVRAAIERLGAERIGHGVRALEDDATIDLLIERGVALEICPTSNLLTGVTGPAGPSPLVALDARGVRCVLDADDPALFKTTVSAEYALAEAWLGAAGVLRLAHNAIEASFAPPARRQRLQDELLAFVGAQSGGLESSGRRTP